MSIRLQMLVSASVLGLAGVTPSLRAATYDAGHEFYLNEKDNLPSETANPNPGSPEWSYGFRAAAVDSGLTLMTDHFNGGGVGGTIDGFKNNADTQGRQLPLIGVNTSATPAGDPQGAIAQGEFLIHPNGTDSGSFAGEQKAVVRFTTPVAGTYNVHAFWEDVNDCCTQGGGAGVDVHVVRTLSFSSASSFDDAISREAGDALNTSTTFDGVMTLAVGETVDFVIGTNSQLYGDSTRFNATLDLVPEPTALSVIAIGVFALARRRRE